MQKQVPSVTHKVVPRSGAPCEHFVSLDADNPRTTPVTSDGDIITAGPPCRHSRPCMSGRAGGRIAQRRSAASRIPRWLLG
ncbi:hypothetical protein Cs7R123_67990 [Catellatospora sp. TT07R-123]|nr:hypothetical protein Cs7R123_67990 [Catellatospora sp. TT07R-123]